MKGGAVRKFQIIKGDGQGMDWFILGIITISRGTTGRHNESMSA